MKALSPIFASFKQNLSISLCPLMTSNFSAMKTRAISSSLSKLLSTKFLSAWGNQFHHNCLWDLAVLDLFGLKLKGHLLLSEDIKVDHYLIKGVLECGLKEGMKIFFRRLIYDESRASFPKKWKSFRFAASHCTD